MRLIRYALVVGALLLASPDVQAQAQPDQAHQLASDFLKKINIDALLPQALAASRQTTILVIEQANKTPEQAAEVFDTYMMPEFTTRLPELRARFEDILVADFTVPELQAIVSGEQNDARRSAAAKAGQLQGQFAQAGTEWGQAVGNDVYRKNKVALDKLGVPPQGAGADAPGGAADAVPPTVGQAPK